MGFPESFALPSQPGLAYRQLGNAVCPPLVAALGACVIDALEASLTPPYALDASLTPPYALEASLAAAETPAGTARRGEREAVRVALQLALAAAPPERRPTYAWLPPALLPTLGLSAALPRAGDAEGEALPSAPACACAVGAAFHAPVEEGWTSWPIAELLRCLAPAPVDDGGRRVLPLRDPAAPAQTVPSPTREAKAEAAALMRSMERVWLLRGDVLG